jgi:hypothetical protein
VVVATTLNSPNRADELYGQRFGIEAMHKDWKSNAFELEKTRVTDSKRIETLLIPIAFAYILCVLEGDKREETGNVHIPREEKRVRRDSSRNIHLVWRCGNFNRGVDFYI